MNCFSLFSPPPSFWVLFLGLLLFGCCPANEPSQTTYRTHQEPWQQRTYEVLGLLREGRSDAALMQVNMALRQFPRQPALHVLSGMVYEQGAQQGNAESLELAEAAYQTATNLDPNNSYALYRLGTVLSKREDYAKALGALVKAHQLRPEDPRILYHMAFAAYYAHDVPVACASIHKALALLPEKSAQRPLYLRASALMSASVGNRGRAEKAFAQLRQLANGDDKEDLSFLRRRMNQWYRVNIQLKKAVVEGEASPDDTGGEEWNEGGDGVVGDDIPVTVDDEVPAAAEAIVADEGTVEEGAAPTTEEAQPVSQASAPVALPPDVAPSASTEASASAAFDTPAPADGPPVPEVPAVAPASAPLPAPPQPPDMVVVLDCVLITLHEDIKTSQGVDLLQVFRDGIFMTVTPRRPTPPALPEGVSWGTLSYNVNILNVGTNKVEIVARPTLSTFLEVPARFESGRTITGAVSGSFGSSLSSIPTGTTVSVTPRAVSDDVVDLEITVDSSLFTKVHSSFEEQALTNQTLSLLKTSIDTKVRLNFNETGMLGGTYERSTHYERTGVPLLERIPIVQYLFSRAETKHQKRSILFLITPRRSKHAEDGFTHTLDVLQNRKAYPGLSAFLKQNHAYIGSLSNQALVYKDAWDRSAHYHRGDILRISNDALDAQAKDLKQFLYF